MKNQANTAMKTTVFNLVILDESGSMCTCVRSTISGCNETIQAAQALQNNHRDSMRSLMSIYAFQTGATPSRYLCRNIPVDQAHAISDRDYRPGGCTPLYDALGSTLVDLRATAQTHEDATAVVTIITDGMENSSTHYSRNDIARLISELKELGWTFNFIGANIDVDDVAGALNIDNRMSFSSTESGTKAMFNDLNACYAAEMDERINEERCMAPEARVAYRKSRASKFFHK